MQNDSKDDGNKGDDRTGEYRDNAADFAESSDLARSGTTGRYSGGGPTDSDPQVREKGEQTWQQAGGTNVASPQGQGATPDGQVPDRSADSGQSRGGGFKNEGGGELDHEGRSLAGDAVDDGSAGAPLSVGGIATGNANLGLGLPEGAGQQDGVGNPDHGTPTKRG